MQPMNEPNQQPAMEPQMEQQGVQPDMQGMDPKEIEQFKQGFQIARQLLYQEPVFNGLIQDIEGKGDPTMVIATAITQVLMKTQSSIGQLSLSVAAALGIALIDDFLQILEEGGQQAPDMQQIFQQAVFVWLSENQYPPEQIASELQAVGASPEMIQQIMQQQDGGQQPEQAPQQAQGLLTKGMR